MNVSNLAFYVGKTSNRNVAIYSFNMADTGGDIPAIDLFNPLDVYWIMREQEGNPREELTSLEKTIGYGYDFLDHQENTSDIRVKIKALPNEPITIKLIDDKYRCIISVRSPITGESKDCYLKKIFLHNSGPLNYTIESFDIIYEDPDTGKLVSENKKQPSSGWSDDAPSLPDNNSGNL